MPNTRIAVGTYHKHLTNVATYFAEKLQLPFALPEHLSSKRFEFILLVEQNPHDYLLELRQTLDKSNPVSVNFSSNKLNYRINFGGGRKQAIGRAIGLKPNKPLRVLDGCAGLGKDALVLASLGCEVTMLERNPVISTLLNDGLRRFQRSGNSIATRLSMIDIDCVQFLNQTEKTTPFDVIYLDPMYPPRSKSALVKKEMRILRKIVGDDEDIPRLISSALNSPVRRIVVKRPGTSAYIDSEAQPSHHIETKNTRFDVYCRPL